VEEQVAAATFVPVSKVSGQAEVDDILTAVRPTTRLVTIMLANNETGIVMPVPEISQRIKALNQERVAAGLPPILVHTDAAQALGKQRVDVEDLGVDFLTIVGHKGRAACHRAEHESLAPALPPRLGFHPAPKAFVTLRVKRGGTQRLHKEAAGLCIAEHFSCVPLST
ncbi:SCLY isoform 12, partial [Pan troglodytes]